MANTGPSMMSTAALRTIERSSVSKAGTRPSPDSLSDSSTVPRATVIIPNPFVTRPISTSCPTSASSATPSKPLPIKPSSSNPPLPQCIQTPDTDHQSTSSSLSAQWNQSPDSIVDRLRFINREHLNVLCRSYITSLVNCPTLESLLKEDDSHSNSGAKNPAYKSGRRTRTFSLSSSSKKSKSISRENEGAIFGSPLTQEGIAQISQLIDFLSKQENLRTEGLFRKTGSVARQRELKVLLDTGSDLNFGSHSPDGIPYFSAHDCANVLKAFLGELPEPLLQEKYFNAHCQVPELSETPLQESNTGDKRLSKKMTALQLLFLLLPRESYLLLRHLLRLLSRVAEHSDYNRMTPETLGTLFAPHVLCPRDMAGAALQNHAPLLTRAVAYMIKNVDALFRSPPELVQSAEMFLRRRVVTEGPNRSFGSPFNQEELDPSHRIISPNPSKRGKRHRRCSTGEKSVATFGFGAPSSHSVVGKRGRHPSSPAATTNAAPDSPAPVDAMFRFAEQKINDGDCTRKALQDLYANIQSMAEGPKKRKYLKMMQKNHGVGNPIPVPVADPDKGKEPPKEERRGRKHSRSRSIGETLGNLKRAMSRGRQRSRSSSRQGAGRSDAQPSPDSSPTDDEPRQREIAKAGQVTEDGESPDSPSSARGNGPWVHRQRMTPSRVLSPIAMSPMDHTPVIASQANSPANVRKPALHPSSTPRLPLNAIRVFPDQRSAQTQALKAFQKRTGASASSPSNQGRGPTPFGEKISALADVPKACGTPHSRSGTILPRTGPEKYRSPLPSKLAISAQHLPTEVGTNEDNF